MIACSRSRSIARVKSSGVWGHFLLLACPVIVQLMSSFLAYTISRSARADKGKGVQGAGSVGCWVTGACVCIGFGL